MAQDLRNASPDQQVCPATSFRLLTTGAVTPPTRGVYVGVSGTVSWTDLEGNAVTNVAVVAGSTIAVALASIQAITDATLYALR